MRNRTAKDQTRNANLNSQDAINKDSKLRGKLDERRAKDKIRDIVNDYLLGKDKNAIQDAIKESEKLGYFNKEMQKEWDKFEQEMKKEIKPNERELTMGYLIGKEAAIAYTGGAILGKLGKLGKIGKLGKKLFSTRSEKELLKEQK